MSARLRIRGPAMPSWLGLVGDDRREPVRSEQRDALFAQARQVWLIDYEIAPSQLARFSARAAAARSGCVCPGLCGVCCGVSSGQPGGGGGRWQNPQAGLWRRGSAASPPLTVSAFAASSRLCLAAAAPEPGENKIETALKVIDLLDVTDRLVTADALHCHTRMADAVVSAGGDYLLALKGNRRHWYNAATAALAAKPGEMLKCSSTAHGPWRRAGPKPGARAPGAHARPQGLRSHSSSAMPHLPRSASMASM